ncbi:hypothetical protein [Brevundimonas sp.]|uniref:hypothetical protein n=1 Tax=Brevundimonas sp. TaxID=1871086 RepID=UPI002FCA2626
MTLPQILAVSGTVASLAGGAMLAVSLSRLITAFDLSFKALELSVDTLAHGEDIVIVRGTDTHRKTGARTAVFWTVFGIALLVVGAALSSLAVLVGA